MRNMDIGYNKEQIVYLPINETLQKNYDSMKDEMLSNPEIQYVTEATHPPSGIYDNGEDWTWEGKDPETNPLVTYLGVGYDYLETFEMKMKEGDYYSPEMTFARSDNVIINEAFAKIIDLRPIIGVKLSIADKSYTVMGVVQDFYFKPVYQAVEPLIMYFESDFKRGYMFAKIRTDNVEHTIDFMKSSWNKYCPEYPFEYTFLDEDYARFYYGEKFTSNILMYFSLIAILISCLGLFGLACFMAERRTKEVGIRKVLGASVSNIIKLLSKEFFALVLIANLIAAPIAYYLMNKWLQDYVYKISLSWTIFAATILLSLVIAILTVSFQAIKAAVANPVDALRYE
jgi:putative ABC transport system permease protein